MKRMTLRTRRRRMLLAVAVTPLMLAAACSSSGSKTDGPGTYTAMVIGPFTQGPEFPTAYPEDSAGALAGAYEVNRTGGVDGKKISVVPCDTQGNPNGGILCVEKARQEGIQAIVGSIGDGTGAYFSLLEKYDIPSIGAFPRNVEYRSPMSYPIMGGAVSYIAGDLGLLERLGITQDSLVSNAAPATQAAGDLITSAVRKVHPAIQVKSVPVATDVTDMSPVAAESVAGVKGVMIALSPAATLQYMQSYASSSQTLPVASNTFDYDPDVISKLGKDSDGTYLVGTFLPATETSDKAVAAFDAAMTQVAPSAEKDDISENAYESVLLYAYLLQHGAPNTGTGLIAALNKLSGVDLGLRPSIGFIKPDKLAGFPRLYNASVIYSKVENGKLVPLSSQFVNPLAS